jgi:hypothetical protein
MTIEEMAEQIYIDLVTGLIAMHGPAAVELQWLKDRARAAREAAVVYFETTNELPRQETA